MSSDLCKNCSVRGNLTLCLATPCSQRDDTWFVQQLRAQVDRLSASRVAHPVSAAPVAALAAAGCNVVADARE